MLKPQTSWALKISLEAKVAVRDLSPMDRDVNAFQEVEDLGQVFSLKPRTPMPLHAS